MEQFNYKQGSGYRVYSSVLTEESCKCIFQNCSIEIWAFVFGSCLDPLYNHLGKNVGKLICDSNLRKQYNLNEEILRKNGNPKESKVLKKSGKTSIYLSRIVRDQVRRNTKIYQILSSIYRTNRLAFTKGLEHLIYKPYMSDESIPMIDCDILQPLGNNYEDLDNGPHYVCIVCISDNDEDTDEENPKQDDGSLSLLLNFDRYYPTIREMILPKGKYPVAKQKKNAKTSVLENLNVDAINQELINIYLKQGINLSPEQLLKWETVKMNSGDMIIFDCRLPYKLSRNRNENAIMFIPVGLRPVTKNWYKSSHHKQLLDSVIHGKVGDWNKKTYKGSNLNEYTWRVKYNSFIGLQACLDLSDFKEQDKLIFGLSEYKF